MLIQTWALLLDAYRELNAKKLFWITMGLSGLVVLAFAAVGINAQGLTVFHWEIPFIVNTNTVSKEFFYKQILFAGFGLKVWLAWGASILALISTAGMIPDFVTGGSLPVMLAKPITRLRLFLTKYATGLLFVALQVLVFCTASFFVLGLRAGMWEPGVFVGVPLVVAFFSFLFCVCALVGLLTRSTIAALIVTGLFWFVLFVVNTSELALLQVRTIQEQRVISYDAQIEEAQGKLSASQGGSTDGIMDALRKGALTPQAHEQRIQQLETGKENAQKALRAISKWHNGVLIAKTMLPKTQETVALTERTLMDLADLQEIATRNEGGDITSFEDEELGVHVNQDDVRREMMRAQRDRSALWIVGTSLLFEGFVLGIASWAFCRRDY